MELHFLERKYRLSTFMWESTAGERTKKMRPNHLTSLQMHFLCRKNRNENILMSTVDKNGQGDSKK